MISPVGSVLSVEMGGGATIRVQVISDGPPDVPSSAWGAVYEGEARGQFVLIRKVSQGRGERARYYGEIRKAAAR